MKSAPEPRLAVISVLLVDDHALFRESVARLLDAEADFKVVGTCATVDEALRAIRRTSVDVVLLDFDLGIGSGAAFLPQARQEGFDGKVLVVTAGVEPDDARLLVRQGVAGIFLKDESAARLASGIREVAAGKVWLDQRFLEAAIEPAAGGAAAAGLTDRERAVLARVFEGLANKEIADRLGVSEGAVKATLQHLFAKTGVRTRGQLVRIALEQHRDLL